MDRAPLQHLRLVGRLLLVPLALVGGALVLLALAVWQPGASVPEPVEPGFEEVARAVALLRAQDPRQRRPGMVSTLQLTERDFDLVMAPALHRWGQARSRVELGGGRARLQLSRHLPWSPIGGWINVDLRLVETGHLPEIERLQIGHLGLPGWLAESAGTFLAGQAGLMDELRTAGEIVQQVHFQPGRVHLRLRWQGGRSEGLLARFMSPADTERLHAYFGRLDTILRQRPPGSSIGLAQLLAPMFELAARRSRDGGDAVAENRAALLVLTICANRRGLEAVLPALRSWPRPPPMRALLAGREDSPLHFLVSAALAAEAGGPLSRAVGIYKEVEDSRGGSGFSFNDLAADRAGTRFGEEAVTQPQRLQARVAALAGEPEFMPAAADLPENLQEAEFLRRFGGVGAPQYEMMVGEIDRRVAALPIYR